MSSFADSVGGEGRRGSFLDHVDMSPNLKNIAVDLLNKNAEILSSHVKQKVQQFTANKAVEGKGIMLGEIVAQYLWLSLRR